ncbi:guanylate kinase [Spirillospora sp. NPDC047279]|uniref:guanylate kinase n=1 Tax=Spirillospora sp. NPDC047279 TaxID=3155478 RepID=UPI0033F71095
MSGRGVILYGPPASGKDTVTRALHQLDPAYSLYRRLKLGSGRTEGYRLATAAEVENLREQGQVIWENHRYGNTYVVDRPSLQDHLATGIPVMHLGQAEAIPRVKEAVPSTRWLVVSLWCPRDIAKQRIQSRATGDTEARLKAWDETKPLPTSDVFLDTSQTAPHTAAEHIDRYLSRM